MKIVLCAVDTKYIHQNLALRLLKANCPLPCELLEFTIKDAPAAIAEAVIAAKPDLVGFSVYLWNVRIVLEAARIVKARTAAKIVAGGPEVAHDAEHFLSDDGFDFIVRGEGEIAFERLVEALATGASLDRVPNLAYRTDNGIALNPVRPIRDLSALASPYRFATDDASRPHKVQYLELARGCPYSCTYCLAPLEGSVRFFPLSRIEDEILLLMERGAKTFKFLDRTFNVRPAVAEELFDFIIGHRRDGVVFQFEIVGDILPAGFVDRLNEKAPQGLFRFEIGIQSTNTATVRAVARRQNDAVLFDAVRKLIAGGKVTVHLDLIAGLPEEDLSSFRTTFDETFALFSPELQLGFLKMLRGTPIRRDADRYGYVYDAEPPYEVVRNDVLSAADLAVIRGVETILDLFWNKARMVESMKLIHARVPSMFDFMASFHAFLASAGFDFVRHQPQDLFRAVDSYVRVLWKDGTGIRDMLKREFLAHADLKRKPWWDDSFCRTHKNELMRRFHAADPAIAVDDLYKYGVVTEYGDGYLLVLYRPGGKLVRTFN